MTTMKKNNIPYTSIIDISWPIHPTMTAYKNKQTVVFTPTKTFEQDKARESLVTMSTHTGTHVDAPSHFTHQGITVDSLELNSLVGPCQIIDLSHCDEKITAADLEKQSINQGDRILLKTKNSTNEAAAPFNQNFVYLAADAARYLTSKKIMTVGIDYLGIERAQPNHETHQVLFENNITIIEGLRLEHVQAGTYFLCCLPLKLQGLDAAPARAILLGTNLKP
jgi:arylformamidase